MTLPGNPPPKLTEALSRHDEERRGAFLAHLLGGTSAAYLAGWLKRAGTPVGKTTIKDYRQQSWFKDRSTT